MPDNTEDNLIPEKYKTDNRLSIIKNSTLRFHPELKDSDIHNADIITKEEKEVILSALNFPKIRDVDVSLGNGNPAYADLAKIIGQAIWTMGITTKSMSEEEQELFIPIAIEEIKNEFSMLSIEEVRIVFKKGSRRHYGDTFQMSIANINFWFKEYINSTKPSAMLRLPFIKKEEASVRELTPEEKEKNHNLWLNGIYNEYNKFKETGVYTFNDFKNNFFFYCKKLGLIDLNEQYKEIIWSKAKEELRKEYNPINERNWGRRIDFKDIYSNLKLDENTEDIEKLIAVRSRKIAVKWFFKNLIKKGKDLKEVIEAIESYKKLNSGT